TTVADELISNLTARGANQIVTAPSRPAESSGKHVAQHLLDTLATFGIAGPATDWSGFSRLRRPRQPGFQAVRAPRVAIHPGSGSSRKNWPAPRFALVAEQLSRATSAKVTLLTGPADTELMDSFVGTPALRGTI